MSSNDYLMISVYLLGWIVGFFFGYCFRKAQEK